MAGLGTLPDPWRVRSLTVDDVQSLLRVQRECYGDDFQESAAVFARRLACAHHCSLGVVAEGDAALQAYLVAYWSKPGQVTPLNGDFLGPQNSQPLLYLHDMSVRPTLSGQGVARHLVMTALAQARARGVVQAALVAVQGSQSFWAHYGFEPHTLTDARQQAWLASYGEGACYMLASI